MYCSLPRAAPKTAPWGAPHAALSSKILVGGTRWLVAQQRGLTVLVELIPRGY